MVLAAVKQKQMMKMDVVVASASFFGGYFCYFRT